MFRTRSYPRLLRVLVVLFAVVAVAIFSRQWFPGRLDVDDCKDVPPNEFDERRQPSRRDVALEIIFQQGLCRSPTPFIERSTTFAADDGGRMLRTTSTDSSPTTMMPVASSDERMTSSSSPSCAIQSPAMAPPCTNELFRSYFRSCGRFVVDVEWTSGGKAIGVDGEPFDRRRPTLRPGFGLVVPGLCRFAEGDVDVESMVHRVLTRFSKIVTLGDSNGSRLFEALARFFAGAVDAKCDLVKAEPVSFEPEVDYYDHHQNIYGNWTAMTDDRTGAPSVDRFVEIVARRRNCHSCASRQVACRWSDDGHGGDQRLVLEHLAMTRLRDDFLRVVRRPSTSSSSTLMTTTLPTNWTQEFLLRDYLAVAGYPQILIIVMPFIHDLQHAATSTAASDRKSGGDTDVVRRLKRDLVAFASLVERHVPTTDVYWITSGPLPALRMTPYHRYRHQVVECNDALFRVLRQRLIDRRSRYFGFLDLYRLAAHVGGLEIDGDPVHVKTVWYETVARFLVELIGNSSPP